MKVELRGLHAAAIGHFLLVQEAFIGPVMVAFYTNVLRFSFAQMSFFFSLTLLIRSAFELPTGALADLFGRKRTLLLGLSLCTLSMASLLVPGLYHGRDELVILLALTWGLGGALASGNAIALLHEMALRRNAADQLPRLLGYGQALSAGTTLLAVVSSGYLAKINLSIPVTVDLLLCIGYWAACGILFEADSPTAARRAIANGIASAMSTYVREFKNTRHLTDCRLVLACGPLFASQRTTFNFLQPQMITSGIDMQYWGWASALLLLLSMCTSMFFVRFRHEHVNLSSVVGYCLLLCASGTCALVLSTSVYATLYFLAVSAIVGSFVSPLAILQLLDRIPPSSSVKTALFSVGALWAACCSALMQTGAGLLTTIIDDHAVVTLCATISTITFAVTFLSTRPIRDLTTA